MILTTIVVGGDSTARERAIAAALVPGENSAVILEGIPSGVAVLADDKLVSIARIAAGCPCCTGNLALRVTLNRVLRRHPQRLFIGLASAAHAEQLRAFLGSPPYNSLLELTKELHALSRSL